jgi:serine/threonine protein kinase
LLTGRGIHNEFSNIREKYRVMENLTGRQLGAYQIVAPLGEGGMAAVYKAYQPGMERYVALKVLPQQLAKDPQFVGRFEQEAKVLANLQHPHILPVFDYGESDGYTYIVMPLVESGTLDDLMVGQPLPLDQVNRIISQVGDALDYAHTQGLIHRDIKPSNILVDERGNCLLTDFGIAKIFEGTARFTQTGGIIGTPAYMSPEQGKGEKVDARSDIYSLGIVLYEMVTGRVPFDAETPIAIVFKHIQDPLPLPRSLNPRLPEPVQRVILKSLAKQPNERFKRADDMVRALQTAVTGGQTGETVLEPLAATVVDRREDGRRIPRWLLPAGVVLLLLGLVGVICVGAILNGRFVFGGTGEPTAVVLEPSTTPQPSNTCPVFVHRDRGCLPTLLPSPIGRPSARLQEITFTFQ